MIIMTTDTEKMEKLEFHTDKDGTYVPVFEDVLFTGVIIDENGELTYANGELVSTLSYETRVLH